MPKMAPAGRGRRKTTQSNPYLMGRCRQAPARRFQEEKPDFEIFAIVPPKGALPMKKESSSSPWVAWVVILPTPPRSATRVRVAAGILPTST